MSQVMHALSTLVVHLSTSPSTHKLTHSFFRANEPPPDTLLSFSYMSASSLLRILDGQHKPLPHAVQAGRQQALAW